MRELKEESRFEPISLEMIDYSYVFPVQEEMRKIYRNPVDYITEIVFLARIGNDKNPVPDPIEYDRWKWCDYQSAMKLLYRAGNKESLKRIRAFLP
ncbi:MAG: NUDIX domain-containing protein [Candidatus Zixiibacteriota bacterium]|nr:MAG: NUDIX domain-containing protein [candidate division Zixibacteria bacterium]